MPVLERMQGTGVQRRRAAIIFADLAESVRLMQRDELAAIERWRRFAAEVRDALLPALGGRMVRTAGDGLLLEAADGPAAVAICLSLHQAIDRCNRGIDAEDAMLLRIGVHVTDAVFDAHEVYGAGVNLASRLAALAQPGQTLVSATVRDGLVDGLHAEVDDLGLRFVKHVSEPLRAFRVAPIGGQARTTASLRLPLPAQDDLRPAVAVVPFEALPADAEHQALGHAMADDIIAALVRHPGLRVLSRLSTANLQTQRADPALVGRLLGASFLLSGHHYRHGGRVRLNVELCALPSAEVVWAGSAMADVDALFAGQDELVPHIVAQVGQHVLSHELARVRGLPMASLASYTLYLGATGLMNSLVRDDFLHAREVLEHLVDRHPRQAAPYAMLARWHVNRSVQGWTTDRRREGMAALEQAQRAIDIDSRQPVALAAKGLVLMNFEGDVEGARRWYQASLAADQQEAYTWANLTTVHSYSGEHEAACETATRAIALSPLDPNLFLFEAYAAMAALGAGLYVQAVAHAQTSLRHHALHVPTHRQLVAALWLADRHDDARVAAKRYLALQPDARARPSAPAADSRCRAWDKPFNDALHAAGVPP